MLEQININSSVPVYTQIENMIQFAITSGDLKSGDQLPSVRELSERLELNPNTVAKAYRDLEVMGYLYTRRGMGVYIKDNIAQDCSDRCRAAIVSRLNEVLCEAIAAGITAAEAKSIAKQCYRSGGSPYGDVPAEIAALAKKK